MNRDQILITQLSLAPTEDLKNISLNLTGVELLQSANFHRLLDEMGTQKRFLAPALATAISSVPRMTLYNARNDSDPSKIKLVDFSATVYGYGYGTIDTSVILSMTVIMAYCVTTLSYIGYILVTGLTSTAWNATIELVTLALYSKRPDHLGHATVGVETIDTHSQPVGIRVNSDSELELVFQQDQDFRLRDLSKIERNKEY